MAGRRARTGRGWDASPPRARRSARQDDIPPGSDDGGATEGLAGAGSSGPGSGGGRWGRRAAAADEPPKDPGERAREICLRLLAVRPRTRAELATALKQRGIEAEVADEVLERYGEVGIIDDAAFARAWVSSRHFGRGLAGRALATELRRKGVDAEAVGAALADIDRDTETATARALVERKLRVDRGGPPDAVLRRLVGVLARKGYAPGLAVAVVRDVLAERAAAAEADAEGGNDPEADTDAMAYADLADYLEAEAATGDGTPSAE